MNEKLLSIIIPTLNRDKVLINTIKDLLNQDYKSFEIIIIDQSDIISKELMHFVEKYQQIKYFHIDEKGSPNAKNVGAKLAKGDILLFLDDDVEISAKKFLNFHLENFENKDIAVVAGRVLQNGDRPLNKVKEVGRYKFFGLIGRSDFNADFRSENIDYALAGNQSIRKSVFMSVGGFSKIFKGNAYFEETDFGLRIKKAGYRIVFDPRAKLKHLQYQSGGHRRIADIYKLRYWIAYNTLIFYLRNFPHILLSIYSLKIIVWAMFSAIKRWDYKIFSSMMRGLVDGIKFYNKYDFNS